MMTENKSSPKMDTIKAIMLTNFGGYEKIKVDQVVRPHPRADNIVIEMKACGMNFSDLYCRQGLHTFQNIRPPFILGVEGAGVVSELGENVAEFKVGDRVMCWNFTYGMWAEFVEVPKNQCYLLPESMTFQEAACILVNYITAYFVLLDFGNLKSGQSVLIQAAAGGVGWAATQLANTVENVTVFGTASSAKHDIIKENGVTHAIDYHTTDFVDEIQRISPSGVDIILDCLSGADFIRSQKILKHMGRLVHTGMNNMISGEKRNLLRAFKVWWQTKNISVLNLIQRNNAVCGLNIASLYDQEPEKFKFALEQIIGFYHDGKIKPRIDSVWSFEQVVDATKCIVGRKNIGKLILVPKLEKHEDSEVSEPDLYIEEKP